MLAGLYKRARHTVGGAEVVQLGKTIIADFRDLLELAVGHASLRSNFFTGLLKKNSPPA